MAIAIAIGIPNQTETGNAIVQRYKDIKSVCLNFEGFIGQVKALNLTGGFGE